MSVINFRKFDLLKKKTHKNRKNLFEIGRKMKLANRAFFQGKSTFFGMSRNSNSHQKKIKIKKTPDSEYFARQNSARSDPQHEFRSNYSVLAKSVPPAILRLVS